MGCLIRYGNCPRVDFSKVVAIVCLAFSLCDVLLPDFNHSVCYCKRFILHCRLSWNAKVVVFHCILIWNPSEILKSLFQAIFVYISLYVGLGVGDIYLPSLIE